MKRVLFSFVVSLMGLGFLSAQLLTDFDANQNITFEGWPNFPTIVANPVSAGINTSANCAEYDRGGEQWAHAYSNLTTPLDFSVNNTFKLKVISPIACTVLFKLENQAGTATTVEVSQSVSTVNEWQQLEFAFPGAASNLYDKIVIFFDFATFSDTIFYFDDVELVPGSGSGLTQISLPVTFEDTATVDYTLTDFGGNVSVLGADPVNAANIVAISTKANLAETWAGTTIGTPAGFSSLIPFTATDTKMKVKVYSPAIGTTIRLKVEDHLDDTHTCETEALTTVANAWETLEFDFSNEAPLTAILNLSWNFDKASIFFDFGNMGAGDVYYWDDVEFMGGGTTLTQISLPVTFEDPLVDYTLTDFGNAASVLGPDPVVSTNTVAITTKAVGAEVWAGTTIGRPDGFSSPIPFTASATKMNLRVYSPAVGIPVLLKVEEKNTPANSCETLELTTVANAWETITFDFTTNNTVGTPAFNLAFVYDKASIFFNFGNVGTGNVFYWDDVMFGEPLSIDEASFSSVKVYPVPVNDMLTLEGYADANQIKIYDVLGKEVYASEILTSRTTVDLSELTEGIYIVTILNDNSVISSNRIIKN
ncbi:MAG: T9SS type A sorting domain-containing protein [Bacteroidales bacterium]|nr:T9SS type A sorting domain-containing protein [Bacteroidales bacterium]MCF8454344.1 T9SS type A sorting domain-containing protein [Bacteroidales bacterium]